MTVQELIQRLEKLPPNGSVRIAYDMNIRMDVEVAEFVRGEVVLTDQREWEDRHHWDAEPSTEGMVEIRRYYDA